MTRKAYTVASNVNSRGCRVRIRHSGLSCYDLLYDDIKVENGSRKTFRLTIVGVKPSWEQEGTSAVVIHIRS